MPRRPSAKQLAKAQERFRTALADYVVSKGAQPSRYYQYELASPAGRLRISVYADWIACRFDDVELGREFTATIGRSCNPFSGKWNFHFFNGYAASLDPAMVIASFGFYLDQFLKWRPLPDSTGVQ